MALEWKDRIVEHPKRYQLVPVDGETDIYDLVAVKGTVTEEGTPVNAVNMNNIEDNITSIQSKTDYITVNENVVLDDINDLKSGVMKAGDSDLLDGADLSTDGTLTDNSDLLIPTQKAVKTYVDGNKSWRLIGLYQGSSVGNTISIPSGSTSVRLCGNIQSSSSTCYLRLNGDTSKTYILDYIKMITSPSGGSVSNSNGFSLGSVNGSDNTFDLTISCNVNRNFVLSGTLNFQDSSKAIHGYSYFGSSQLSSISLTATTSSGSYMYVYALY